MKDENQNKQAGEKKPAAGSGAAMAAAPAAPTNQPSVVTYRLDAEQFAVLQKTLVLSALVSGLAFRKDVMVAHKNLEQLAEKADVLLKVLE